MCNFPKRIYRLITCLILIFGTLVFTPGASYSAQENTEVVRIGVLAKRGAERCILKWGPTAYYLTNQIPGYSFVVVPLGYDEIYPAVERKEVDFILTNSSFYVEMESHHDVRRIVTFKNLHLGKGYDVYGGVIFCRADRKDIKNLQDLKSKSFMAVEETSFGGWRMAWRKLKQHGIDPYRDFADLQFGGTHDTVVYTVLDGRVDAGTVRTDTLERMAIEGKIRLDDFRVFPHKKGDKDCCDFPFLHTTDLYPEWPLAKVKHTSDELAEKVAAALLRMSPDSPAAKAARCAGWTIPHNYQPVHDCLKELRVGPYKDYGKVTFRDILQQYWRSVLAFIFLVVVILMFAAYVIRLNGRLRKTAAAERKELAERKRAEEMLRESKERFRSLIETTSDWIWEVDQNSTYTYASPKVRDLLGYEPEEVIGKTPFDLMPSEEARRVAAEFAGYAEARRPFNGLENTNLHKDSHVVVLETSGVPVFDNDGDFRGYRGIDRDITERKRSEEELKRRAEEFEIEKEAAKKNAIELVTAFDQLNEAKQEIELAKQKAEEVNRELKQVQSQMVQHEKLASIGQLASGVAHEMNTPVGFVASNFQTLESYVEKIQVLIDKYEKLLTEIRTLDETELQNEVDAIREYWDLAQLDFIIEDIHVLFKDSEEGLERISSIIENLRDFSRIDQAKEFAEYNINEGLEATLVVARNEIKYHADVKTDFFDIPPVYCSASQINQVFLNILVNAAQAIKSQEREDRGIISIKTYTMADELVCEISDDGPGIPPEKLLKVFDPFFTTKPAGKGTGLGLSISYDIIVNKHHGNLLVESTVGKGTKFTIKLPLNKDEKPAQEKDKKQWNAEQFCS